MLSTILEAECLACHERLVGHPETGWSHAHVSADYDGHDPEPYKLWGQADITSEEFKEMLGSKRLTAGHLKTFGLEILARAHPGGSSFGELAEPRQEPTPEQIHTGVEKLKAAGVQGPYKVDGKPYSNPKKKLRKLSKIKGTGAPGRAFSRRLAKETGGHGDLQEYFDYVTGDEIFDTSSEGPSSPRKAVPYSAPTEPPYLPVESQDDPSTDAR